MPIRPPAMTWRCPRCHWQKTVHPESDALQSGDWFDKCPKCGRHAPECREATAFEKIVGEIISKITNGLKS